MLAVIKALELAEPDDIIHTDNSKKPVANQDLWQRIDKLKQEKPTVVVKWVRGHSGVYGNELADNLATKAAA